MIKMATSSGDFDLKQINYVVLINKINLMVKIDESYKW